MSSTRVITDRRVPALVVKTGQDPIHSGTIGAMRPLDRLGVPLPLIGRPLMLAAGLGNRTDVSSASVPGCGPVGR